MATLTVVVRGMTCGACVRLVQQAIVSIPGVRSARVTLETGVTVVEHDGTISPHAIRVAIERVGYTLKPGCPVRSALAALAARPLLVGPIAGVGLLALYLVVITVAQGWAHAVDQFEQDRPFVLALAAGFGLQAGLYSKLRVRHYCG